MRRLADISGPFFDPHKPFRNWSSFPFAQIDSMNPPYVDAQQLSWGVARAQEQLHTLQAQGYTGIVIDNLAHLVTFDNAPFPVYTASSPFRLRALAYRAAFGQLFDTATILGMELFVTSDMQWSTPPLRAAVGSLHADNPRLIELNRCALHELFVAFPQIAGLVIRVGEAGGAHNEGNSYTGHMLYTSPARLRALIGDLLPICEQQRRLLIVRTWSVGIGELGDLIWSPDRYHETFGGLRSSQLLVSIKHGPADFFRLLPANPTLGLPGPRQIVELQNRREYELFGMVPSSVAALHQAAMRRAAADPQCAGIWAWNSTGGWGGGRAALGNTGWNLWTELSSALSAALAQTPELDTDSFVRGWLGTRLHHSGAAFAAAVADLYIASAELIEQGWYLGQLPRATSKVGAVYLPPLLWVWWVRPTASLPIWAYLAYAVGNTTAALQAGDQACALAQRHAATLAALAPANDSVAATLVASACYLASALDVAQAARALMLPLMDAAWQRKRPANAALRAAAKQAQIALARHQALWSGNGDTPALELAELEQLAANLISAPGWIWVQARAACVAVRHLHNGRVPSGQLGRASAVSAALISLALLARRQGFLGLVGILVGLLLIAPMRRQTIHAALPWLSRRLHLMPSIFFEAGPSISEWAT